MPVVDMCSALIRKRKCQRLEQHMTLSNKEQISSKKKKNKEKKLAKDM